MKRDLGELQSRTHDLAIIGGGVIGAAIARDAARRGLLVALIERHDFASAASEAMSHTIHGGIRYLAQGKLSIVREGLAERKIWLRTAPDFVAEQPFILPLYGGLAAFKLKAGVSLYQAMAGRKPRFVSAREAIEREPVLASDGLAGAAVYDDARIDDPAALVIAMLKDAARHGAMIANHVEAADLGPDADGKMRLRARDILSGSVVEIGANQVVNATGPWAQKVASALLPGQRLARVTASKGIHVVTPALTNGHAIALSGKQEHGFVLPWMGMSLVGTTDDVFLGDAQNALPSEGEVDALAAKISRLLPRAAAAMSNLASSFAGVRALPGNASDTYQASRETAFCDHETDGLAGFHSVFGGKWTTARLIARAFVDRLAPRFGKTLRLCDTAEAEIQKPPQIENLAARLAQAAQEDMAVTGGDFGRRLGRHALISDPQLTPRLNAWLASNGFRPDTGLGQPIGGRA